MTVTMTMTDPNEFYKLGRDAQASARLTHQHWLFKDQWNLVHSSITSCWANDGPATPRKIADVACGNAIWCMDVAGSDLSKDLQVVGFDLSDAQFPPHDDWPSNVNLQTWNMFTPPPAEYEKTFDMVNVRLVVLAVPDGDPRLILSNVLKLLKPGGILQWSEFDLLTPAVAKEAAYHRICELISNAGGPKSCCWIKQLPSIFVELGLEVVQCSIDLPRKAMHKFWIDNFVISIAEMTKYFKSPEMDEWWKQCERERTEQGVMPIWPIAMCIGKKPT